VSKNISGGVQHAYMISLLLLFMLGAAYTTKSQDLPTDKVNALIDRKVLTFDGHSYTFKKGIIQGRYMEDSISGHECPDAPFPKWEEFHLKKCTYQQPDVKAPGKRKTATAIMLNPEKEVLAKWIIASCLIVKGDADIDACANKLAYTIIEVSGSQFAIAGIVLEDERPKNKPDGVQEAYTFRDGVTVSVQDGMSVGFTGMFGPDENGIALDPNKEVLSTASGAGPARIQNTTRQMYRAYMGAQAKDVTGTKWVDVVRELYQDAWRRAHDDAKPETVEKYRNDLMVAKCYSLMGVKPPKKTSGSTHVSLLTPTETNWGCYDPRPGHPTTEEKQAFVTEVIPYAQEAEQSYGIPAAALIAMACNEGGYGFTRTALEANNIYGWKYYGSTAAEGRNKWILSCQPSSDPNNRYVKFSDRKDAVLFVARKLSTLPAYRKAAQKYLSERAAGVDIETAVGDWVRGIVPAYNPYPHYVKTTVKFMNNYLSPSDSKSEVANLYQYSASVTTHPQ
jgi:hypothetical protein